MAMHDRSKLLLILDLIAKGLPAKQACLEVGISRDSFNWQLRQGRAAEVANDFSSKDYRWLLRYRDAQQKSRTARRKGPGWRERFTPPEKRTRTLTERFSNSFRPLLLTDEKREEALKNIREGTFADVAFGAVGWEAPLTEYWLSEGARDHEAGRDTVLSSFYIDVLKAESAARADAEKRIFADSPAVWALSGPARLDPDKRPGKTGWTRSSTTHATVKVNQPIIVTQWKLGSDHEPSRIVEAEQQESQLPALVSNWVTDTEDEEEDDTLD
jgi:hypothetical protein